MSNWRTRLDGRRVIASISGGKDSAAMSLWLTEQGIEHERVFADTGWEHPETYRYIWDVLVPRLGPITVVYGPRTFEELVYHKGMFPSRLRRFCTEQLKIKPLQAYIKLQNDSVVNAIGIRAGESAARSQLPQWEWNADFDCETWRPLIDWTESDVIATHKRHDLPPNPLYLLGARRVGCWPCIYARKEELRLVATTDPERIQRIRVLEDETKARAAARYEARGETFESLGYTPPTFFHTHAKVGSMISIDQAVDWAMTARGGKQYDLFVDAGRDGCMRWGMCETEEEVPT